ncbi:MAG TPA: carboxypeptidase-like regulatory domain-containing protein, partial [Vicinamibacterales bacterium]|nr:carboxypeptidase-like regulatory domain-containing protein [Vicinamibacterales bacterium]
MRPLVAVPVALLLALAATPAHAQTGSSGASLSGVVADIDGGLMAGATVVVRNNATGESFSGVTNAVGAYTFPGLAVGSYTVTISRPGFKTAEYSDVRLLAGSSNSLTTTLEVGPIAETVHVTAGTDLIRTQTATVSTTVLSDFIQTLPRLDRNALNFVVLLPGVQTIGGEGTRTYDDCGVDVDALRTSTVSGLPSNTINVTIDGISTSNMRSSCDGFHSMVTPRLDAVEEVSVTSATAGAAATGQGAAQIRFVTRSGTDQLRASLYLFGQHKNLNSNTFFERLDGLERLQSTEIVSGGRLGGPIVIPNLVDGRGRAFFFVNLESAYRPKEAARDRTIIRASALDGNFTYNLDNPTTVNLWAIAAASGQTTTYDPVILELLRSVRSAASTTGTITELATDPNRATFDYVVPNVDLEFAPTVNLTFNLTPAHRLQGSYYWQRFKNTPFVRGGAEARFPGFPLWGDEDSYRTTGSVTLRSVISPSMVNEVRGGWQWSPLHFQTNATPDKFANQGGFDLQLGFGLTSVTPVGAAFPSARNTANWAIEDTVSWLTGSHAVTFGGSFSRVYAWQEAWRNVPGISLGVDTRYDPAEMLFGTGPGQLGLVNFPGSSPADRRNARSLYALLTGRVVAVSGEALLDEAGTEYVYNGHLRQSQRMDDVGFFIEDRWTWRPNLTITAGLRYQLQIPMTPTSGTFTAVSPESVCGPSGLAPAPSDRFCNIFN